MRWSNRNGLQKGKGYAAIKSHFEESLPRSPEAYNNFHALIAIKEHESHIKLMRKVNA
jgi:endonuclease III-like uncharacterized protein